jgi:hypothetical protein
MNKSLRPGSWILPVLIMMVIVSLFTLSGCRGGAEEPPINEDSVKPHVISITEAAQLTANFRNTVDTFNKKCPPFKDSLKFGYSEAFNSDSYRLLLKQKDSSGRKAAGIRIYYGLDKNGQVKMVLVPYDSSGNDILNHLISVDGKPVPGVSQAHTESLTVSSAQAVEQGQLCPTYCPTSDPLQP